MEHHDKEDSNHIKKVEVDYDDTDIKCIIKAIENDNNADVMLTTFTNIKQEKNDILQQLKIKGKRLKEYHRKLKEYRFIDDISSLRDGCYIRWMNIMDPEHKLTYGAIVCSVDEEGGYIYTKSSNAFPRIRHITIQFENVIVFQKLTDQESILLKITKLIDDGNID